jgi:UDP-3-O-[3-hydroxymyristoyl] N-acetylglucosamine deacetylase / 3-hydroxyacyl-[acyl-carrier-protein] dehydratase
MPEQAQRVLSEAEVSALIPHVRPFRFIDGATIIEPGKKATAQMVDLNHPDFGYLKFHFPGMQIAPGGILAEAMAEVLGVAAASSGEDLSGKIGLYRSIKDMTFRIAVKPTDAVTLEADLTSFKGRVVRGHYLGLGTGKVRALVDGKVAVDGTIGFTVVDRAEFLASIGVTQNPTTEAAVVAQPAPKATSVGNIGVIGGGPRF